MIAIEPLHGKLFIVEMKQRNPRFGYPRIAITNMVRTLALKPKHLQKLVNNRALPALIYTIFNGRLFVKGKVLTRIFQPAGLAPPVGCL
ncbi:MAG: hypothetical protein P8Y45_16100 [Exilibacterium sp.]